MSHGSSDLLFDFVVVGAGIVGLTVAHELRRRQPGARIAVLEKEPAPGLHASGRNSGVMHSGIYYDSNTLKARVCAEGARRMIEYARAEGVAVEQNGKVILATSEEQLPTIEKLLDNARGSSIPAERIDHQRLKELEPCAAQGPAAIYCPTTAVIDGPAVLERLREQLERQGTIFIFNCHVDRPDIRGRLRTSQGVVQYAMLFNCAGAYADILARSYGLADAYTLVPFKGIYWKLSKQANSLVRANIYPVPDISMPFLGVHLTKVISGDVYIGPTAIPALGRENYGGLQGVNISESLGILSQLGGMYLRNENNFRRLAHVEMGKYKKAAFLSAARKLVPRLTADDMEATPKAGIRPQLINIKTRRLEMDYIIERSEDSVHVLNAISPAFTSSFAFAELIVDAGGIS